jgi:hypothetical protein
MKWTTEKPTESGWFWYRGPLSEDQPMVVHVYDVGKIFYTGPWPDGHTVRLERSFGEWAGPLEPPKGRLKEDKWISD